MRQTKGRRTRRQTTSKSKRGITARQFGSSTRMTGGFLASATAFILVLCVAFMMVAAQKGNVVNASGGPHPGPGPTRSYKGFCGNPGQPTCPSPDPRWFSITSESPQAVAVAITNSKDFGMLKARYGNSLLDTPVLIHSFGPRTGIEWYDDDHWVVSARNGAGKEVGLFDFVYDRSHQRLRFSSFAVLGSQDPHAYQAFPYISTTMAAAQLKNQRKLNLLAGTQPELIFFAINPSWRDLVVSPVGFLGKDRDHASEHEHPHR